jgi:hypothetical protein
MMWHMALRVVSWTRARAIGVALLLAVPLRATAVDTGIPVIDLREELVPRGVNSSASAIVGKPPSSDSDKATSPAFGMGRADVERVFNQNALRVLCPARASKQ